MTPSTVGGSFSIIQGSVTDAQFVKFGLEVDSSGTKEGGLWRGLALSLCP